MLARVKQKLGIETREGAKKLARQIFFFCSGGLFNTAIFYGTYYLLHEWGLHYILSNAAGFVLSTLFAYVWNRRISFKSEVKSGGAAKETKRLSKMLLVYTLTFLLSNGFLWLLVEILQMHEKVAPILSLFITMPVNFLANKFWIFK